MTIPRNPRFVTVRSPSLIGEDGRAYYLDHQWKRIRKRPRPLFDGYPRLEWTDLNVSNFDPYWGPQFDVLRSQLYSVMRTTAKKSGLTITKGAVASGAEKVITEAEIRYQTCQVVAGIRQFQFWHHAWGKAKLPVRAGAPMRVSLAASAVGITGQLRALQRVVQARTTRYEVRWRQTTPGARFVLQRTLDLLPAAELRRFATMVQRDGTIISSQIPSPEFLAAVLPDAIALSRRRHGPRYDQQEALLHICRLAFLAITRSLRDRMTVGYIPHPTGEGADFIRAIETIFDIPILPNNSHHMIKRVRKADRIRQRRG